MNEIHISFFFFFFKSSSFVFCILVFKQQELQEAKSKGEYNGDFMAQFHYFGYEGRSGLPSNFDVNYCYSIGYTAAALVEQNETGLMASIGNITSSVEQWTGGERKYLFFFSRPL